MTGPLSRLVITSGDSDGIGPEVTTKALLQVKAPSHFRFYLWRSPTFRKSYLKKLDARWKRITVTSWDEALLVKQTSSKTLVDINSPLKPPKWVETSGRAGFRKQISALVTAPLSKETILAAGLKDCGHTDILKRTTKTKNVFMTFLGNKFNVALLTGHVPIHEAYNKIDKKLLESCLTLAQDLVPKLGTRNAPKPIGVVGCNPHAGENGVIDRKEGRVYQPVMKVLRNHKVELSGPLVPDVCFQPTRWNRYSMYIASYHDQGLIPFKMVHHNFGGVQLSMGLPFVRTSVDHGTAKDIYGKNKAREASMVNAIKVAMKLVDAKPIKW